MKWSFIISLYAFSLDSLSVIFLWCIPLIELYAKRILEKYEKKEISENNFENKNGSLGNLGSHFCENDKILKEKEAELDHFVHQPPRGGGPFIPTEH